MRVPEVPTLDLKHRHTHRGARAGSGEGGRARGQERTNGEWPEQPPTPAHDGRQPGRDHERQCGLQTSLNKSEICKVVDVWVQNQYVLVGGSGCIGRGGGERGLVTWGRNANQRPGR